MQIQVQSIHFDAEAQLLEDVTKKLSKLEKLYDRIESCNVMLRQEKSVDQKKFLVEVRMAIPGEDLFASEKAESFGRALDRVSQDLKKQIIKHKEKLKAFDREKLGG